MSMIFILGAWLAADLGLMAVFAVAGTMVAALGAYVARAGPGRKSSKPHSLAAPGQPGLERPRQAFRRKTATGRRRSSVTRQR
jgi:hypothetical protein